MFSEHVHQEGDHAVIVRQTSPHQQPNNDAADTDSLQELSPGQCVSIQLKRTHHVIKNFFVFTNQKRTASSIELLNLSEFYLTQLGHVLCFAQITKLH